RAGLQSSFDELPLVGKPQHAVFARKLGRERVERARELENLERGLIELGRTARAANDGRAERAVRLDAHFKHGTSDSSAAASGGRVVQSADAFHLAPPAVEVGRKRRGPGVRRDPQLVPLRSTELRRAIFVSRPRLLGGLLFEQERTLGLIALIAHL